MFTNICVVIYFSPSQRKKNWVEIANYKSTTCCSERAYNILLYFMYWENVEEKPLAITSYHEKEVHFPKLTTGTALRGAHIFVDANCNLIVIKQANYFSNDFHLANGKSILINENNSYTFQIPKQTVQNSIAFSFFQKKLHSKP